MSFFSGDDLVFYQENNKIMSGGYLINSIMLKEGIYPMTTINEKYGGAKPNTDKVSSLFENLAVPAGLFYINPKQYDECLYESNDHVVLSDDIHDKLFGLIEIQKKKRKTKKQKDSSFSNKKISRKNKFN
jgi:hypothetical protein